MSATMKLSEPARSARRPVRVTGRKIAASPSSSVPQMFRLEPRDRVRQFVAAMSSDGNSPELLDVSTVFIESLVDLNGLLIASAEFRKILLDRVSKLLRDRGVAQVARPLPVQRLRSPEHHGYPLRRTQRVIFNREKGHVTAELKEVSRMLDLRGIGADEDLAFRDLERQFDRLVHEKVRIPPHAREERDEPARLIVNHLVDWEQFSWENPAPRLLWGQIGRPTSSGLPMIYWLIGPNGVRKQSTVLPRKLWTPYFSLLEQGAWFRAVVLEYPDRVEWIEPPSSSPDPTDPSVRKAAWEAIPHVYADTPDVWPLKDK
jgi:hypothetical protein